MQILADRLHELAAKDVGMKVFGAYTYGNGHGYRLNRCLTEADVVAIEREYCIQLPTDYRDYLTQVGNGGAGPYYGLMPLQEALTDHQRIPRTRHELTSAFPLVTRFNPYDEADDEADEECRSIGDRYLHGAIRLAHQGCGYFDLLVITGPQRGWVWTDGRVSDQGLAPLNFEFYEWYAAWLAESLAQVA